MRRAAACRGAPAWTVLIWLALIGAAQAAAEVCEGAGARAAAAYGVPAEVMQAISLTETGRARDGRLEPWPWTVNMEGAGKWFDSRAEAQAYVDGHHARGARSYDIGCFQINYRWHGEAFASNAAMFDPDQNAGYAARFLRDLYAETGSWSAAAGAYHSRTPRFANRYRARFDRILARLTGGAAPPPPSMALAEPGRMPEPGAAPVYGAPTDYAALPVDAPLTVSPPSGATAGSLAGVFAAPQGQPLLRDTGAPRPLLAAPPGPLF